jgi:hypothetical protein
MPDDFTRQVESADHASSEWVSLNPLSQAIHPNAPYFIILLCLMPDYFTLSNARQFYSSSGEYCHSMG